MPLLNDILALCREIVESDTEAESMLAGARLSGRRDLAEEILTLRVKEDTPKSYRGWVEDWFSGNFKSLERGPYNLTIMRYSGVCTLSRDRVKCLPSFQVSTEQTDEEMIYQAIEKVEEHVREG